MAEFLAYTTLPTGKRRDTWWKRMLNGEPMDPATIEPGVHEFTRRYHFTNKHCEAFHDAALEAGYESELCYFDDAWIVRVREPGADEPHFVSDDLEAPAARIPRS